MISLLLLVNIVIIQDLVTILAIQQLAICHLVHSKKPKKIENYRSSTPIGLANGWNTRLYPKLSLKWSYLNEVLLMALIFYTIWGDNALIVVMSQTRQYRQGQRAMYGREIISQRFIFNKALWPQTWCTMMYSRIQIEIITLTRLTNSLEHSF